MLPRSKPFAVEVIRFEGYPVSVHDFDTTTWDAIEAAASGDVKARDDFVTRYRPGVQRFLRRRWRGTPHTDCVDDATQEVFLECFKSAGVLGKADRSVPGGFRPYFKNVVRNVAGRYEQRGKRTREQLRDRPIEESELAAAQSSISRGLDREWAREILRAAAAEQARRASELGPPARLRLDILRYRFEEGRPIREIAAELELEASYVHHQFAKAKRDFHAALLRVMRSRFLNAEDDELDVECRRLMDLLG